MSAKGADLPHSEAVRALWGEKDEEASEKWRNEKVASWEAGGKLKEKYGQHPLEVATQAGQGVEG